MRRLLSALRDRIATRLPRDFRVLHSQFLLRVIDLEALSIDADILSYLGQFAGILIMLSLCHGMGLMWFPPPPGPETWIYEQARIADIQLVIGLCAVLMWDTTFPDKRDSMVLGPLPVLPRTILLAKLSASSQVLGIAIVALNFASAFAMSIVFGSGSNGIFRFFFCWWFTLITASLFLYGSVLAIQGLGTLLLPRRISLVVSAVLQLAAFGAILAGRFLQPWVATFPDLTSPAHHNLLAWSPTYWFFALFNYINGTLPRELQWIANRASIALAIVVAGSIGSLALCYLRTMKNTVEQPDIDPGSTSIRFLPNLGRSLQAAITVFAFRSITRSRQHRIALAFYWSIVISIALSMARKMLTEPPEVISTGFILPTIIMMGFAVVGLRGVFSLPISLKANWVLRVTQLRPTSNYVAATRRCLFLFGVLPVLAVTALLSRHYRPVGHAYEHIAFLSVFGWVLVELCLVRFDKVPFTCSFIPGKTNIQVIFWGAAFVCLILGLLFGAYESRALQHPRDYAILMTWSVAISVVLWISNRIRARSAVLYYDEVLPEVITRLGLTFLPPPRTPEPAKIEHV
ncbi:hypothetical protein [Occallatibacter savannae]|uniref:hypothetical protein n=1 Tax=Occallatibacter savannae TaxID=1002691 RepID=UPI000D68C8B4|nr:hypothetical protein [Occallatibacter savannae]